MINLYNQVPSVYTSASRDFQYLSWLFNIVLNSVKHNVDDLYDLPNVSSDPKLTELLALTLGFKVKRNYDETQLRALVAILPAVLKYKGTKKAVEMAARALVKATGSLGEASVDVNGTSVEVTLPKDLIDVTLFLDLLDYILPAGMSCRVIRKNEKYKNIDDILVKHRDELNLIVADDLVWSSYNNDTGLARLYEISAVGAEVDFTSNIKKLDDSLVLNTGLLDNTVIPVLADSKIVEVDNTVNTVLLYSTEGVNEDGSSITEPIAVANGVQLRAKKFVQEL